MFRHFRHNLSPPLLMLLIAALALRGLIPSGYMPGAEGAFTLQLCHAGLPTPVLDYLTGGSASAASAQHGSHHGSHQASAGTRPGTGAEAGANSSGHSRHQQTASIENCVFGAAPGVGPVLQTAAVVPPLVIAQLLRFDVPAPIVPHAQRFRLQQPRAPPAFS